MKRNFHLGIEIYLIKYISKKGDGCALVYIASIQASRKKAKWKHYSYTPKYSIDLFVRKINYRRKGRYENDLK